LVLLFACSGRDFCYSNFVVLSEPVQRHADIPARSIQKKRYGANTKRLAACESSFRTASSSWLPFSLKSIKLAFIGIRSFGFSFCLFKDVINNLLPFCAHLYPPNVELRIDY